MNFRYFDVLKCTVSFSQIIYFTVYRSKFSMFNGSIVSNKDLGKIGIIFFRFLSVDGVSHGNLFQFVK